MTGDAKQALERLAEALKDLPKEKLEQVAAFAEGAALMAERREETKAG